MSINIDDGQNNDDGTTKINVRTLTAMVDATGEEFARRGCAPRSEVTRDVFRDWLNPSVQLSKGTFADLQKGWVQRRVGKTISPNDASDRYDVDVDDDQAWMTDVETIPKADSH